MSDGPFACPYCHKVNIASKRGLSQHINKTPACKALQLGKRQSKDAGHRFPQEFMGLSAVGQAYERGGVVMMRYHDNRTDKPKEMSKTGIESEVEDQDFGQLPDESEAEEEEQSWDGEEDGPDHTILADFNQYAGHAARNFMQFTHNERQAINLMWLLRRTKASLDTYEAMMRWHLESCKKLRPHEKLGSRPEFIGRPTLFSKLLNRYNLVGKVNIVKQITVPSSRAKARIIKNDAKAMLQSLLTDPRIVDDDYLFFNNDPRSSPPDDKEFEYIGDINTGLAYTETYKMLITKPGEQVLLPIIIYLDAAATGQFADLPVTALKFTLGIFNRKAREKPHLWRTLGYLPKISKNRSRGRRKLLESGHVDAMIQHRNMLEGEGNIAGGTDENPAQDLHTMLAEILGQFVEIQNKGFMWDLVYRKTLYEDIEFVPFVPFIKCDTEEADRLAGKYTTRTGNVAQLCRYCCCPTQECDRPRAVYPRKTVPMIQELVEEEDKEGLKNMSQQFIINAMYQLRFGAHNEEGVHGACPLELLHALLLGMFKYIRGCFFEQVGGTSQLAKEVNALAVEIGVLFGRQSDRDMPKTKFSNGIQQGKLMAKEFTGVLLIIAAILRSTEGRRLLCVKQKGQKKGRFAQDDGHLEDWIMLVETVLMWEEWLKSDVMAKKDVHRARRKHLYIMYLMRKVGNRTKGMGLKIMKFHAIMHMAQDIIHFGVPMNFDTGSDESGHKPSKTAAKVTQKRKETFDEQVGIRLTEVETLCLAREEFTNRRPLWQYSYEYSMDTKAKEPVQIPRKWGLGGGKLCICHDKDDAPQLCDTSRQSKGKKDVKVELPFKDFLVELAEIVAEYYPKLEFRTTFHKDGVIYRGTADYAGVVWRDWVMVEWYGTDGQMPSKIWGFVDFRELPPDNVLNLGGLQPVPPAIYAIVEVADYNRTKGEAAKSELFIPIKKEVGQMDKDRVVGLTFYLANVDDFVEPIAVIPDIGGPANAYFMLRRREQWREDFISWLRKPYEPFEDFEEDGSDSEAGEDENYDDFDEDEEEEDDE